MHGDIRTDIAGAIGERVGEAVRLGIVDRADRADLARFGGQPGLDPGQESGLIDPQLDAIDVAAQLGRAILDHQEFDLRIVLGEVGNDIDEFGTGRNDDGGAVIDRRADILAAGFRIAAFEDFDVGADRLRAFQRAVAAHLQIDVDAEGQRSDEDDLLGRRHSRRRQPQKDQNGECRQYPH